MPTPDASQYIQIKRIQANATASVAESSVKFRASLGLSGYGFIPGLKARFGPNALISNKFLQPKPSGPQTTPVNISYEISNLVPSCGPTTCTFTLIANFPHVTITDASVIAMGPEAMTVVDSHTAHFVIDGYFLPVGTPIGPLPVNFVLNSGKYIASGPITIQPGAGSSSQSAQLYVPSPTVPFTSGGSMYFVGELDGYVCAGANSGFAIPTATDFTVMWWQLLDTRGSSNQFPRPFSMGVNSDVFTVSMEGTGATKTIYVWINGSHPITVSGVNVGNAWHHFAVIRHGTTMTLYKDGVSIGSATINTAIGSDSVPLILGQRYTRDNQAETFVGWISKFVFYNGLAVYTANFTPPVNDPSFSPDGGPQLMLLCSDFASVAHNSGIGSDVGFYGNTTAHTPGFAPRPSPPGLMSVNTAYTFPTNTPAEYGTYSTSFVLDFIAPSTGTYTITYSGISGALSHVISTSTPGTYITDRMTQTPQSFSTGDTISLSVGDHLYMMPASGSGLTLSVTISD